jgi:hypothetical protein
VVIGSAVAGVTVGAGAFVADVAGSDPLGVGGAVPLSHCVPYL